MTDLLSLKSARRWYPLIHHPVQVALVTDDVRFKVVPAGRRSGKTERAKRYLVCEAATTQGDYFAAAPTYNQAKRIWWNDLKILSHPIHDKRPSESDLIISLKNGSSIHIIGLDQPERIEGKIWHGGIIDEIANIKKTAWAENIAPALDTMDPSRPGHLAWCWLIGVPEGLNHYYDLAQLALSGTAPDWKLYTWKSSEILPQDTIDAAKRRMSARQFRQEYEASFEFAQGRIYEDFSEKNTTNETIKENERLIWCHDFNFSPMSSCICVIRDGKVMILDEIILQSAVVSQAASEFIDRYAKHNHKSVILYGDPAGRAGQKHGQKSNWSILESSLRDAGWNVASRVPAAAPAIRDRQNAVRGLIANAVGDRRLFVNQAKCPYVYRGLSTVQFKEGSTFLENEGEYQHVTTAIGYFADVEYPVSGKASRVKISGV